MAETGERRLILTREGVEEREDRELLGFACKSGSSRGRRVSEAPDDRRTEYQRDRDRIIHSAAFRRLIGKTQVFVSDTGDHYRVRLTHSLEVSQVARSIARTLGINEDLCETLALAHDLGHTPFGHSGGDVLDDLMTSYGGFEHNRQSLRLVDRLETRYPDFRGLNLTYEVRESILKHKRPFEGPDYAPYHPEEGPCLEAQVADMADGIAYNSHDLDDGLRSGLLEVEDLADVALWRRAEDAARARYSGADRGLLRKKTIAMIIHLQVTDLIDATEAALRAASVETLEDVRAQQAPLVRFSEVMAAEDRALRQFLYERFYTHYKVCRMRNRARVFITGLFETFQSNPELMPPRFQAICEEDGLERGIADYISGMTDRYAQSQYAMLFHPGAGSLDP